MNYMAWSYCIIALVLSYHTAETNGDTIRPNYDYQNYKLYDIKFPLVLSCNVTLVPDRSYTIEWLKEDKPVSEDPQLKDRHRILNSENTFIIDKTLERDAGNYTCRVVNGNEQADIVVVAKPQTKLVPNTSVIEGEKLKLTCIAHGNPTPVVKWTIGNETYEESRGRIILSDENGVQNSILTIAEAILDDRGDFTCQAHNVASQFVNSTASTTYVRVKDKLAALWPFLGICAEVFVLCTIILIYEKRRNKPELEESDTDQSPDQKHIPEHGKDVRHRK